MKVALSKAADADLDAILDYGIARHGSDLAEAYLRTIDEALSRLSDYPKLGQPQPDLRRDMRRLSVAEHAIFYRLDGELIRVVRVLHKAMDSSRHV